MQTKEIRSIEQQVRDNNPDVSELEMVRIFLKRLNSIAEGC